jgi:hypothetical protein
MVNWTLATIRSDEPMMSWLEERRFEWVPLARDALSQLMKGSALIIVTDKEREWFGKYLLSTLNRPDRSRPVLPVFEISGLLHYHDRMGGSEEIDLINNMFSLSMGKGCLFWYIGRSDDVRARLPKKSDGSFLWILDEELQNSFHLRSGDDLLDLKLMHLARLFDKSIDAAMFGEIDL